MDGSGAPQPQRAVVTSMEPQRAVYTSTSALFPSPSSASQSSPAEMDFPGTGAQSYSVAPGGYAAQPQRFQVAPTPQTASQMRFETPQATPVPSLHGPSSHPPLGPLATEQSVVNSPMKPQEEQQHQVSLKEALEVIADTVLQIVLFQVEVEENESFLTTPHYEMLVSGVRMFSSLAEKKALQWEEAGEPQWSGKMGEYGRNIKKITIDISNALNKITINQFDQDAKEELLFSCSEVMKNLIPLLEISDRYDSEKIIKQVKKTRDLLTTLQDSTNKMQIQNIQETIRLTIFESIHLAKLVMGRRHAIQDPELEYRLDVANDTFRSIPEKLIEKCVAQFSAPNDPNIKAQRDTIQAGLLDCLDEIIVVVRLSQERMFKGLLLGLDPISRNSQVNDEDDMEFLERVSHVSRQMDDLWNAFESRAPNAMMADVRKAKQDIDRLTRQLVNASPIDRDSMQIDLSAASQRLKKLLDELAKAAAKGGPKGEQARKELEEALKAWKAFEAAAARQHIGGMDAAALDLQLACVEMSSSIDENPNQTPVEVEQKTMSIMGKGKKQLTETQKLIAENPEDIDLQAAARRLAELLKKLAISSKQYGGAGDNDALQQCLQDIVDASAALAAAGGGRANLGQEAEDLLNGVGASQYAAVAGNTKELQENLGQLSGNDLQNLVKGISDNLNAQLHQGRARRGDPRAMRNICDSILALSQKMAPALRNLLDELRNPIKDEGSQARVAGAAASVANVSKDLLATNGTGVEQLLDHAAALRSALGESRTPESAARANASVGAMCKLAREIGEKDPVCQAKMEALCRDLVGAQKLYLQGGDPKTVNIAAGRLCIGAMQIARSDTGEKKCLGALASAEANLKRLLAFATQKNQALVNPTKVKCTQDLTRGLVLTDALSDLYPQLSPALEKLEALEKEVHTTSGVALDPQKCSKWARTSESLSDAVAAILVDSPQAACEEANACVAHYGAVLLSAPNDQWGDNKEREGALHHFVDATVREQMYLRQAGKATNSAALTKVLGGKMVQLQDNYRAAYGGVAKVMNSPQDPSVRSSSDDQVKTAIESTESTTATLFNGPLPRIKCNSSTICRALNDICDAINQRDAGRATTLFENILPLMEHQLRLVGKVETSGEAQQKLRNVQAQGRQCVDRLSHSVPQCAAGENGKNTAIADVEMAKKIFGALSEYTARAAALKAEPVDIKNFADAAKVVTMAYKGRDLDPNTPKGRLYLCGKKVAGAMEELANAKSKREIIAAATKLASHLKTFVKDAEAVGKLITRKKSAQELVSDAHVSSNFALQLKILCAVKLATDANDASTEDQLVNCGAELARAVVRTLGVLDVSELYK